MKSNQINIDQRQTFYRRKFKIKGPNRFPGINIDGNHLLNFFLTGWQALFASAVSKM